jgi:AraC-like DNA-binding protein
MLQMRQAVMDCPAMPNPLTTLTHEFSGKHEIPPHTHPEHQLIYASRGVMTVRTDGGIWVVPPQRGVWIPAKMPHAITIHGAVSMRTLYVKPRLVRGSRNCCVVSVSALLRELILEACTFRALRRNVREEAHLIDLIVDQLAFVEVAPLQLIHPSDPRALRVAEILSGDPGNPRSLTRICERAGASKRTVERLFRSETNMSLGQWRQQLRLVRSLHLLAEGETITRIAMAMGYSTPSAFISMFRKALGTTPRRYFTAPSRAHHRGSDPRDARESSRRAAVRT